MSIMNELKKNWHKFTFSVDKNKPTLYFAAGIVGVGFTIYTVARGTWKAKDIVEDTREEIEEINSKKEDEETPITEEEAKEQIKKVRIHEGVELVKTYALSASVGVASFGCLFASNTTWKKRYAGTTAALAALTEGYNALKSGVLDKFGEDVLKELVFHSEGEKEDKIVDEETGEITVEKNKVVNPKNDTSPYAVYFTESNPYWTGVYEYDINFIKAQQTFANEKLKVYGHFILNESRRDLGFESNKAGMVVGWINKPHNTEGDNYIEYICEKVLLAYDDGACKPAIRIDFNVDGNIYDRLE